MSGTITANQYFEFGGLRIDLSKVNTIFKLSLLANGPVQIELTNQIGGARVILNCPESGSFLSALDAYRESLKPKYQFKDGWYVCRLYGPNPKNCSTWLRYFRNDVAYGVDGRRKGDAENYTEVISIEDQPPIPDSLRD